MDEIGEMLAPWERVSRETALRALGGSPTLIRWLLESVRKQDEQSYQRSLNQYQWITNHFFADSEDFR